MDFIKRLIIIAGRDVPGIQLGPSELREVTLPSGKKVLNAFAEVLTLRTTNPVGPDGQPQDVQTYLTITPENLRFSPLRFDIVPGLDVDEDTGAPLSLEVLHRRLADNIATRQLARAAMAVPSVISLDDEDEVEGDPSTIVQTSEVPEGQTVPA